MTKAKEFDSAVAAKHGFTREDWDAVNSPDLTDDQLAQAKPLSEALPDVHAALTETIRKRGPEKTKTPISIRLDLDLVEKLRATGPGWQSRVNDALRKWVEDEAA